MKILYAEKSGHYRTKVISVIRQAYPHADIIEVSNLGQARRFYDINRPDIVITGAQYPNDVEKREGVSGQLLLEYVRRQDPKKPIIITYSSLGNFEDFTINSGITVLPKSCSGFLRKILAQLEKVDKTIQTSPDR